MLLGCYDAEIGYSENLFNESELCALLHNPFDDVTRIFVFNFFFVGFFQFAVSGVFGREMKMWRFYSSSQQSEKNLAHVGSCDAHNIGNHSRE